MGPHRRIIRGWFRGTRAVAGAASAESVPRAVKAAILLALGELWARREDTVVGTIVAQTRAIENLLAPHRVLRW